VTSKITSRSQLPGALAAIFVLAVSFANVGCDRSRDVDDSASNQSIDRAGAPDVMTVCYPLQFLAEQIAGDEIDVECVVPPDADGSQWRPGREEISHLQAAKMIVINGRGAEYANWLTMASIPDSRLCETATRGLSLKDYIAVDDIRIVHSHGPEGEHSHPTMVAYTWLDPVIAEKQARYITDELKREFPQSAERFEENFSTLKQQLAKLSQSIESINGVGKTVVTTNPKLKFLTRAAKLEDVHFNWTPATSAEEIKSGWASLEKSTEPVGSEKRIVLLTTFPLSPAQAEAAAGANAITVELDSLDQPPETGDYLTAMAENIERLTNAIERSSR
jgi:zinc transport system substrate-binding protein